MSQTKISNYILGKFHSFVSGFYHADVNLFVLGRYLIACPLTHALLKKKKNSFPYLPNMETGFAYLL